MPAQVLLRRALHIGTLGLAVLLAASNCIHASDTKPAAARPAAALEEFPLLGRLLAQDHPWDQEPGRLAAAIFSRKPKLAQGDKSYPLLFSDQRELSGWPGEKVLELHAYESEYYAFDREYPVIKLHLGRPLLFNQQHGRIEALAKAKGKAAQFPPLDASVVPPFLVRLDALLLSLGAKKEAADSPLVSSYLLSNSTRLTVTNLSGSTNGTPYVELMLTPQQPVTSMAGKQTLAFPGAEGAARFSRGGRGGKVYIVDSLEDYLPKGRPGRAENTYGQASEHARELGEGKWRPYVDALGRPRPELGQPLLPAYPPLPPENVIHGTLREAIEASGPRYVVFAVSGDINLKDELVIRNPYITIAGQSAPGMGVQLRNWGIEVATHDVILRHLRIRVGDTKGPGDLQRTLGEQTHALDLNGMNVIADHCDIAYANDQVFNVYGTDRRVAVTLQWSYIYGAPTKSTHEKGNHSMMMVGVGWGQVSLHHNLIAHGRARNPRLDMLTCDFRNNVLYNFDGTGYGSDNDYLRLNYIGNTLRRGPDTKRPNLVAWSEKTRWAQWYGADNQLPENSDTVFAGENSLIIKRPHLSAPVHTHPAAEAYRLVLEDGGAAKPARDSVTNYVALTVRDRTGSIPARVTDWPEHGFSHYPEATAPKDRNRNGIPDEWEKARGLASGKTAANGHDLDPSYDNVEVYLNSL